MAAPIQIVTILLDADSLPAKVRETVYRRALKEAIPVVVVANRRIPHPRSEIVRMVITDSAAEAADAYILSHVGCQDLVVTRDIPLAYALAERGIRVINDRGVWYDLETARERLSIRNFSFELRSQGIDPGSLDSFGSRQVQAFAATFDRAITTKYSGRK